MIDPKRLLDEFLGSQTPGKKSSQNGGHAGKLSRLAKDNPMATSAIVGVLLGTKKGRKLGKTALKWGGMAAVAGLAYKAYQDYQSGQKPSQGGVQGQEKALPSAEGTSFHPSQAPQGEDVFALALVRAMIAAARADGHIDDAERARIAGRLQEMGVDQEEEAFLVQELERPVDLDDLIAAAQTEAQKIELYTASRLAIEPDSRAERGYLDMLAGRLKLPDPLVDHIEATVTETTS